MKDKQAIHSRYLELKQDYLKFKSQAKNSYDFYNLIEKSVLGMEEEAEQNRISDEEVKVNGMVREDLQKMCQFIRVLSM
jgi:hypothetical protein